MRSIRRNIRSERNGNSRLRNSPTPLCRSGIGT